MLLTHGVQNPSLKSALEQAAESPLLDFLRVVISQDTPCTVGSYSAHVRAQLPKLLVLLEQS